MSPIGKKKCSYSPMQKRGLISDSPVMANGNTVSSTGEEEKKPEQTIAVDRPGKQIGGNVNYMIRDGYQPTGEYVNDKGTRIVKYVPTSPESKASPKYMQFNNKIDGAGKLHYDLTQEQYIDLLERGQGGSRTRKASKFIPAEDYGERDMSGEGNRSMTAQVTGGPMAGNFEPN